MTQELHYGLWYLVVRTFCSSTAETSAVTLITRNLEITKGQETG